MTDLQKLMGLIQQADEARKGLELAAGFPKIESQLPLDGLRSKLHENDLGVTVKDLHELSRSSL